MQLEQLVRRVFHVSDNENKPADGRRPPHDPARHHPPVDTVLEPVVQPRGSIKVIQLDAPPSHRDVAPKKLNQPQVRREGGTGARPLLRRDVVSS